MGQKEQLLTAEKAERGTLAHAESRKQTSLTPGINCSQQRRLTCSGGVRLPR